MKILGKELTFNGNKVYHAGDKPTTSEIGALGGTAENGYMGMTHPDKSTSNWIRTTNQGLIPFSQDTTNGVSSIGTSSWPFKTVYAKTFNGALSGNAATATKLQTARTIALKGAVNGSGSFDGSGNLSINTNTRIFSGGGTGGESGYVAFAQLVITSNYVNRPIEFKLICRGKVTPCYVSLMFANANNTDPTLSSLKYWGTDYGVFAHKVGTSTWLLYYTKSESYDNVTIVGNDSASQGVTITYPGTFITTKPTTNVFDASLGGNFGAANTATTLQTARTINGTSFNGSGNITTANWGTARTITIGKTGKSVNGSGNVSWTLAEIGAANIDDATTTTSSVWSSNKTQTQINTSYNTMLKRVEALEETAYVDFVGTKGGTMTGNLNMAANINLNNEKYVYAKKANGTAYEVLGFTSTDSLIVGSLSGATTIRSSNNPRVMVGSAINTIYHEGYKPTPSAIGALATSGGALSGKLTANGRIALPTTSGMYLTGKDIANAAVQITTQQTSGAYHPILAVKSSGGHTFNLGGIGDLVGFYGYQSSRTENGTDWSVTFNAATGSMSSTSDIVCEGVTIGNKTNSFLTKKFSGGKTAVINYYQNPDRLELFWSASNNGTDYTWANKIYFDVNGQIFGQSLNLKGFRFSADTGTNNLMIVRPDGAEYAHVTCRALHVGAYSGVTKKLSIESSAPASPNTGDVWIQV